MTWYILMPRLRCQKNARPRVIRGTRTAPLPLLPSGPGGVCSRPLHEARDLTSFYRNMRRETHSLREGIEHQFQPDGVAEVDGERTDETGDRGEIAPDSRCRQV